MPNRKRATAGSDVKVAVRMYATSIYPVYDLTDDKLGSARATRLSRGSFAATDRLDQVVNVHVRRCRLHSEPVEPCSGSSSVVALNGSSPPVGVVAHLDKSHTVAGSNLPTVCCYERSPVVFRLKLLGDSRGDGARFVVVGCVLLPEIFTRRFRFHCHGLRRQRLNVIAEASHTCTRSRTDGDGAVQ